MADLNIVNRYWIELNGVEKSGKQGSADDSPQDAYVKSVDGNHQGQGGTLATGTVRTIWDEDDDNPTGFDFFHFWADQDCYLQLVGQTTNVIIQVKAKEPFTLSTDQILAAANTTVMTTSAPSVEAIDSIVLLNASGTTLNYEAAVID